MGNMRDTQYFQTVQDKKMEVSDVLEYEKQLLAFVRAKRPEVLDTLNAANELTKDVEEKIVSTLDEFKTVFKPAKQEN